MCGRRVAKEVLDFCVDERAVIERGENIGELHPPAERSRQGNCQRGRRRRWIAMAASTALGVGDGGKDAGGREEDTLRESKKFEKCGAGWFGWEAPVVVVASISAC